MLIPDAALRAIDISYSVNRFFFPQACQAPFGTENLVRYGMAALICLTIAVLIYAAVVAFRLNAALVESVAALGVAWWLVGCGLVPLTAYWAWRGSVFDRSSE